MTTTTSIKSTENFQIFHCVKWPYSWLCNTILKKKHYLILLRGIVENNLLDCYDLLKHANAPQLFNKYVMVEILEDSWNNPCFLFAEFLMGQASQALYPWASIWLLKSTSIQPGFFFTCPISFYVTNNFKCWYSQQGFCSFVISTKSKRYPIKKVGFWYRFNRKIWL